MSTNGQYEEVDEDQLAENTQRMCRVANLSEKETRKMLGYCESPIERLFLTQIIYAAEDGIYSINAGTSDEHRYVFLRPPSKYDGIDRFRLRIYMQKTFELEKSPIETVTYRPDFYLQLERDDDPFNSDTEPTVYRKIVVEIDGHDYHERTKEQAMRDRERDRIFQRSRFYVMRYTASEVYRRKDDIITTAFQMLEDVWSLAEDIIRKELQD